MAEREFRGIWIPSEIWLDKELSALDKVIFAEIDSLDTEESHCFASNEYLAEFCNCSVRSASASIQLLIAKGYIGMVSFDGRRRVLQSRLAKSARQTSKTCTADEQNLPAINIDDNPSIEKENTSLSGCTKENRRQTFVKPTLEEVRAYCLERKNRVNAEKFWDYYNSNGWRVGKNPMKDWKAAVRTWEQSDKRGGQRITNPYYDPNEASELNF